MKSDKNPLRVVSKNRPVYFISNRPEASEVGGEVSVERAASLAAVIVQRATRAFPGIDFRIDGQWHSHDPELDRVAAYIESHWAAWASSKPGKASA